MTGTLYIVPTPIGNLEDITLRAIRVLSEVDLIAAEDTRHTRKLLSHFQIHAKLTAYHQHNKHVAVERIMHVLDDRDVALVSDSGMPGISDPGYELIAAAIEQGVRVELLPGPSVVTAAVALAAMPAPGFLFLGFLPRRRAELEKQLRELEPLPFSLVVFEAPVRVLSTLTACLSVLGNRRMAAIRELSKMHEEVIRGNVEDVISRCQEKQPRGEWTLVVAPAEFVQSPLASDEDIVAAVTDLKRSGVRAREAAKHIADQYGISRSDAYQRWLEVADAEA